LRKFSLVAAAVALVGGALTACFGGPPPPPPTDPHDVLVVGDSVGFSFGCVLGDPGETNGIPQSACPQSPDYTTRNDWAGGCTITPGTLSLYNSGTAPAPNCDTAGAGSRGQTWQDDANSFVPKVVVINTAGWEIVDRWLNPVTTPDAQWGGNTSSQEYMNAAVQYSNQLYDAINMFRASPNHPTVIIANAPYIAPTQPEPPPGSVPAGIECSFWEPNPPSPPVSSGPDCTGNATAGSGGSWRPQAPGISYRSSKAKLDQFNGIVSLVKNDYFASDNEVVVFNFKKHFNDGPNNQYTDYVCPPPNDATIAPQFAQDLHTGATPGTMAWQCNTNANPMNWDYAILARDPDHSHLSPTGQYQILQPYIDKCVRNYLGLSGGDLSACT
jgi:hypothetical protein